MQGLLFMKTGDAGFNADYAGLAAVLMQPLARSLRISFLSHDAIMLIMQRFDNAATQTFNSF
jgi:hypothetical protein